MVLPKPISSAIRHRPAFAANSAPSRWYSYSGTLSSDLNAADFTPRGNSAATFARRCSASRTSAR